MPSVRLAILVATYLLIALQQVPGIRLNRPAASLLGAVAMVTIGGLPMRDAYAAIDLNVIVFLLGVLLLTGFLELSGFFQWAAARIVECLGRELLLFFGALFVVMRGVRDLPLVMSLTSVAGAHLDGAPLRDATIVSGAMLALSNLVSNVPAVLLWIPVVPTLHEARFVWLVMAMSATFAGNLTLIGSMANLIVAERAAARGEHIAFLDYLKVGVPATLLTLLWGIAALLLVRGP